MKNKISYEQALNDQTRTWLRLEHLFHYINDRSKGLSYFDSRAAVDGVIELLVLLSRLDVQRELISALEGRYRMLKKWQENEGIDRQKLNHFLKRIENTAIKLDKKKFNSTDLLEDKPLLQQVYRYHHLPAGRYGFDIPIYQHWLQRKPQQRRQDLIEWLCVFEPLSKAVDLILYFIRQNALVSQQVAKAGLFQSKLDGSAHVQLVRVIPTSIQNCYPEISGSRHRITIRFFDWQTRKIPVQNEQDIGFELVCCQ